MLASTLRSQLRFARSHLAASKLVCLGKLCYIITTFRVERHLYTTDHDSRQWPFKPVLAIVLIKVELEPFFVDLFVCLSHESSRSALV